MNRTLGLVIFGVMFIMSMFMLYPETSSVNLTDQGTELLGTFSVDSDWENEGTLDNLNTNGDIIYPDQNSAGNWTSFLIQGEEMDVIDLQVNGDVRDGTVNVSILLYESDNLTEPSKVLDPEVNSPSFNYTFDSIEDQYDYFSVKIEMVENDGSNNQRPNVDSLTVNYIENLDRQGLGFDEYAFQVFALFVFIGLGLLGLLKEVK